MSNVPSREDVEKLLVLVVRDYPDADPVDIQQIQRNKVREFLRDSFGTTNKNGWDTISLVIDDLGSYQNYVKL